MSLTAILDARERRWLEKQQLARHFHASVLSLCLNIPGPDKNPPGVEEAFARVQTTLREAHASEVQRMKKVRHGCCAAILHEVTGAGADGPTWLMVSSLSGLALKRMAVRLEGEHPLGRLADIDILTKRGEAVSRADIGLPPRSCFLCGEPAVLCRRGKRHSQAMLMEFVASLLENAGIR